MGRIKKLGCAAGILFLSFYCACIISHLDTSVELKNFIIPLVCAALALGPAVFLLLRKLSALELDRGKEIYSDRFMKRAAILAGTAAVVILLLWFLGFMPGGYHIDAVLQWEQAHGEPYNDWHPVLHTLLFFTLPTRLWDNPSAPVLFQFLCFGAAVGYLIHTMAGCGCGRKYLVLTFLYVVCGPATLTIMMFPMKDAAFTTVLIVLAAQTLKLHFTDGTWLLGRGNRVFLGCMLGLAWIFRHNGVLYALPFLMSMFLLWKKQFKNILKVTVVTILLLAAVKGVLYRCMDVQKPGARVTETTGIPMTMAANVLVNEPEALSEDSRAFLYEIADQEEWELLYTPDEYNNLKRQKNTSSVIEKYGYGRVLHVAADALIHSPVYALEAFLKQTDMVWDIGVVDFIVYPVVGENTAGITYSGIPVLRALEEGIIYISSQNIFGVLFWSVGMCMLVLLFAAASRFFCGEPEKIIYICPMLIYNFGTMLMLMGDDFRFFHFSLCIFLPLLFLILTKTKKDPEVKEEN